jgi:hypothetical protein
VFVAEKNPKFVIDTSGDIARALQNIDRRLSRLVQRMNETDDVFDRIERRQRDQGQAIAALLEGSGSGITPEKLESDFRPIIEKLKALGKD